MSAHAFAGTDTYASFTRQIQKESGIIWDMPNDSAAAPLSACKGESMFQHWSIDEAQTKEYLLTQKLVRNYLPKATIRIETLDPDSSFPRSRVDQPFSVRIEMADLLTGVGLPDSTTKILVEQHLQSNYSGKTNSNIITKPFANGCITSNGTTILKFPASSLTAKDRTQASGEEHFMIQTLADGNSSPTEIASAFVQVCPVASGAVQGIASGDEIRDQLPTVRLALHNLYPRSDTYLMLYQGTQIHGVTGRTIISLKLNQDTCVSKVLTVKNLADQITSDGTYTIALLSETVYGNELLCDPITFRVKISEDLAALSR